MLGSLASQTGAFQVSATDAPDGTGTLAGSSGSTS
jgi:hypothetical protein